MSTINRIAFICVMGFLTMWMNSSDEMFAELHKRNGKLRHGLISEYVVSSAMHCLHKCRRTNGCKGINVGRDRDDKLTCQLTSVKDDGDVDAWDETEGWDHYQVVDEISQQKSVREVCVLQLFLCLSVCLFLCLLACLFVCLIAAFILR